MFFDAKATAYLWNDSIRLEKSRKHWKGNAASTSEPDIDILYHSAQLHVRLFEVNDYSLTSKKEASIKLPDMSTANTNGNAPTNGVEDLWENNEPSGPTATGSKGRRKQEDRFGEREEKLAFGEMSLGGEEDSKFRDDAVVSSTDPQTSDCWWNTMHHMQYHPGSRPTRLSRLQRYSTVAENRQPGAGHCGRSAKN